MYSKNIDFEACINAKLSSPDWGIWGKEKYKFNEKQRKAKYEKETAILNKINKDIPERLRIALRFSYAICDLKAYSAPITESEFNFLSGLYKNSLEYVNPITDVGFRELIQELYFINKTASEIPGFTKGMLVNETIKSGNWRKYVYLDFFKFSCINTLMRESINNMIEYSDEVLTSKFVLAYFLGTGSFIEKTSVLFSEETFGPISNMTKDLCKKIELYPEFPDIQYQNFYNDYERLLNLVKSSKEKVTSDTIEKFQNKRYEAFNICNHYYSTYYNSKYINNQYLLDSEKPLKLLLRLYHKVSKSESLNTREIFLALRSIRLMIDEKYYDSAPIPEKLHIKSFLAHTTHPFFQALLYEGKILSILYLKDHPENGKNVSPLFNELVPFYAYYFKKKGRLFDFNYELPSGLPRLILAHHVHNANCKKLYDKMAINKLLIWDSEKLSLNVSSSSSKPEIVMKERENCLLLGYNHYRIHARQHLKAGNQNRAIFNATNGAGEEYYFTLDDDYFAVPNFALDAHKEISTHNLDYIQAPLAFKGIYDNVTIGEQIDAESMHFFESTYGYTYPKILTLPRGTGTIFSFTDGRSSVVDTGGFLVDFSCEDFGQGFISLIQNNSTILGSNQNGKVPGKMAKNVYVIGEGIDLNGKIRQVERWSHGHSKVLFHLLIPVLFKSLIRGETKLVSNKQFILSSILIMFNIISKFVSFLFLCLPFIYTSWYNQTDTIIIDHKVLLSIIVAFNFINLFACFFYNQGKISYSPFRLMAMEAILTLPSLKGNIKGMLGLLPKGWRADKSKKFSNNNFLGIYAILLLNIFTLVTIKNFNLGLIFWTFFNITLIGGGILILKLNRHIQEPYFNVFRQLPFNVYLRIFILSIILNIIFFILEFDSPMNAAKFILINVFLYSFILTFRITFLNTVLLYKQNKRTPDF